MVIGPKETVSLYVYRKFALKCGKKKALEKCMAFSVAKRIHVTWGSRRAYFFTLIIGTPPFLRIICHWWPYSFRQELLSKISAADVRTRWNVNLKIDLSKFRKNSDWLGFRDFGCTFDSEIRLEVRMTIGGIFCSKRALTTSKNF